MSNQTRITFLNLPIGRGHPFYLEGIIEACNRSGKVGLVRSVENLTSLAPLHSRAAWRAVDWLYHVGSSPGRFGKYYSQFRQRNDLNRGGPLISVLGAGLSRRFGRPNHPVVVSHPILVPILRQKCHLIYQHGELVAPDESLVTGANMVIVPTESVAGRFRAIGYSAEQILISGLCIEPAKVRQAVDAYHSRLHHYADNTPLTGAFFSSAAEPSDHVDKLIAAALATVAAGHSAIIFARRGRRLHRMTDLRLKGTDHLFRVVDAGSDLPVDLGGITLVLHTNHREENIFSSRLFPHFDFFVAPSHERSNWAVGLGLPMFVLDPPKGSFAPLNRQFLLDRKVAFCLSSFNHAQSLGSRLDTMRHRGQLRDMAEAGWQSHDISGFETIVNFFSRKFGLSTD